MIAAHDADADDADVQAAAAEILSPTHNAKSPPAARPYTRFPVTMSDPDRRLRSATIRTQIASQAYGAFFRQSVVAHLID